RGLVKDRRKLAELHAAQTREPIAPNQVRQGLICHWATGKQLVSTEEQSYRLAGRTTLPAGQPQYQGRRHASRAGPVPGPEHAGGLLLRLALVPRRPCVVPMLVAWHFALLNSEHDLRLARGVLRSRGRPRV